MYRANKLIDHRTSKTGGREYLVVWHGRNKKGKPWEDSWHKEEDITPDLVEQYEGSRAYGVHSMPVEVDAAMVFFLVRKSLSHALMFGAFKGLGFKGRNRPRVHCLQLPLCQLQAVALGLLEVARSYGGPKIKLEHGNTDQPSEFWQLTIKDIPRIAKFCAFEHFLDKERAIGNVRLTGTSRHSGDMLAIGPPSSSRSSARGTAS